MSNIDYFEGLDEVKPTENTLERLRELADDVTLLEDEIETLTIQLTEKQEKLNKINRVTIPGIMEELNMKSFKLADGSEVLVEDKVQASIKAENKVAAYAWLKDHGFDGIIKTNVGIQFSKGEMEDAQKAMKLLADAGFSGASLEQSIHNATLTSFVKERLAEAANILAETGEQADDGFEADTEKAVTLPLDIFSVFEFKQAKIKAPKKKRK